MRYILLTLLCNGAGLVVTVRTYLHHGLTMCQFLQMIFLNIRLKVVYFVGYIDTNFAQDRNYNELMCNSETFSIHYERLFRYQHGKHLFEGPDVVC